MKAVAASVSKGLATTVAASGGAAGDRESTPIDTIVLDARGLQGSRASFSAVDRELWSLARFIPSAGRRLAFCDRGLPALSEDIAALFDDVLEVTPHRPGRTLVLTSASSGRDIGPLLPARLSAGSLLVVLSETIAAAEAARTSASERLNVMVLAGTGASPEETLPALLSDNVLTTTPQLDRIESMLAARLLSDGVPVVLVPGSVSKSGLDTVVGALAALNGRSGRFVRLVVDGPADRVTSDLLAKLRDHHKLDSNLVVATPPLRLALRLYLTRICLAWIFPDTGFSADVAALETVCAGGIALKAQQSETLSSGNFPQGNSEALADLLKTISDNATAREGLRASLRAHLGDAREQEAAPKLWHRILTNLPKPPPSKNHRGLKPRIAFLAAYPPQEIGVPIYSRETVNALTAHADVDLWTEAAITPSDRRSLRSLRRIGDHFNARDYDQIISVVGNHQIHVPIYDLAIRQDGAMVLHDPQLLDFFWGRSPTEFRRVIDRRMGRKVEIEEIQTWFEDRNKLPQPFLDPIIDRAQPAIVHSPIAKSAVKTFYKADSLYLPVAIQHEFAKRDLSEDSRRLAKQRCSVDPKSIAIGTFGAVHPVKGDKQCIYAIRDLRDWGYNVNLYFVGVIWPELRSELELLIEKLDLEGQIHFSERISEERYMEYLQAMDFAVQIRRMPFGQVSGALLDAISAGLPGVASRDLAEAIDAPDFVSRVDDISSPLLLAEAIASALDEERHLTRAPDPWQAYVKEHSFARYAESLISALL